MKTLILILTATLTMLVVGCGAKYKVNTNKLSEAFAAAPAEVKGQVDKVAASLKAGDFTEAVEAVSKVAESDTLSAEQKTALYDAVVELNVVIETKKPANNEALLQKTQELIAKLL